MKDAISCDLCEAQFKTKGEITNSTRERARINGWAIWSGTTYGGRPVSVCLCPRCRDDKRKGSKVERLKPPEGSQPLF